MSKKNEQLVDKLFRASLAADIDKFVAYLSDDVVYQNMPWDPVVGRDGVRNALAPFIHGPNCALVSVDIINTTSAGDLVMCERLEHWRKGSVTVDLPVMGVFEVVDGKITKWRDYFDGARFAPIIEAVAHSSA